MIAGFLSRFGKFGVILGFIAGNVVLAYVSNGNTEAIIYLKEIVVASLGLLLVPKRVEINIEDFFGKDLYLPVGRAYEIEANKDEAIDKLNTVSETINELSKNYNSGYIAEDDEPKTAFMKNLIVRLDVIKDNVLYEDLLNDENEIIEDIYNILEERDLTKEDVVSLFEKRNEYIVGFDDFDTNMKIINDINKAVRLINDTYKIGRVNKIWKQRMKESKKVMSSQLAGVSRAISDVAKSIYKKNDDFSEEKREVKILCGQKNIEILDVNIEQNRNGRYSISVYMNANKEDEEFINIELENVLSKVLRSEIVFQNESKNAEDVCRQVYVSKDKFFIQIGIAKEKMADTPVSGDSNIQTRLDDGKYLIALSDGMGSGADAKSASQLAVNMLNRMLSTGFDKDTSLELINSSMYINSKEDTYATLDVAILDLFSGNMEFMKNGACPTFIKNKKNVQIVKSISLPTGILDKVDLVVYDKDLEDGDIIIMCSDGILESKVDYENKEIWVKNLLEEIETDNVQKIANILLAQSIDNGVGVAKDDMTVIAVKVKKN